MRTEFENWRRKWKWEALPFDKNLNSNCTGSGETGFDKFSLGQFPGNYGYNIGKHHVNTPTAKTLLKSSRWKN